MMQQLIEQFADASLESRGCAFTTLARSIVGQQISVKAAESVWQRVIATIPEITPHSIAAAEQELLRSCGLSARKVTYLQDLSWHFREGDLSETAWGEMNDEAVIKQLIQVKGIGRWTAEMFLIFGLRRPDVLSLGDAGLQRAARLLFGDDAELEHVGQVWQPFCSVASWYLWRHLDA